MSEDDIDPTDGSGAPEGGDVDPGEPIPELAKLGEAAPSGFLHRLRQKIARRSLTGSVVSLAWYTPLLVILEFLKMVFQLFAPKGDQEGESR